MQIEGPAARCADCVYSYMFDGYGLVCRRFPPKEDDIGPKVYPHLWCGEFSRKQNAQNHPPHYSPCKKITDGLLAAIVLLDSLERPDVMEFLRALNRRYKMDGK